MQDKISTVKEADYSFTRLLNTALTLYKKRFRAFIIPGLAITLPLYVLYFGLYFGVFFFFAMGSDMGFFAIKDGPEFAPVLLNLLQLPISGLIVLLSYPAMYAQHVAMLYGQCTGGTALRFTFRRYGRAVGVPFISALPVMGSAYVAYIPFVFSMVSWGIWAAITASFTSFSGEAYIISIVALCVLAILYVCAVVYAVASLASLIIPASAKLDLSVGKAVAYSFRRAGRIMLPHICVNLLYMLCAMIAIGLPVFACVYAMQGSVITTEMGIAATALIFFLSVASALFGQPFQIAVNCAAFELTRER